MWPPAPGDPAAAAGRTSEGTREDSQGGGGGGGGGRPPPGMDRTGTFGTRSVASPATMEDNEVSRLLAERNCLVQQVQELKARVSRLSDENQQQRQQNQEKDELVSRLKEDISGLFKENEQLLDKNIEQEEEIVHLKKELGKAQGKSPRSFPEFKVLSAKDCHIQFRIAGKTGGAEKKFLEDVSKRLSRQGVALRSKEFTETSEDPLLLFCPIASRMGSDIDNALEGLTGKQKVLLVVMHFLLKDKAGASVDTRQQGSHPAVVQTVHARYTLQEGLYPCEMNKAAVAGVAAAIKGLAKDP